MTYSIVAIDRESGELGVAVQSHAFMTGAIVTWAWPGVGAVATQSTALVAHGPGMLELMRDGASAPEALAQRLSADEHASVRQLAAVDRHGNVAVHTGADCIPEAGDVTGDGVSCQANIMRNRSVWGAMLDSFNTATGPLEWRLMSALDAGEEAGGDIRGKQSAAILVVPATGEWWETKVSLRVEDHAEPLLELRRLLRLHDAHRLVNEADELLASGQYSEAAELFQRGVDLAPGDHELMFWAGNCIAAAGDIDAGLAYVREAVAIHPEWAVLLPRLSADVAPAGAELSRRISASE